MRYAIFSDIHANAQAWPRIEADADEFDAEVFVCLGDVVGYGPDQATLRMNDELPRYQPDVVVLGVFAGNDFGSNPKVSHIARSMSASCTMR